MDKEYFLSACVHFEPSPVQNWQSLFSSQEMNCSPEQSLDCFLNPKWDKSTDQYANFESALSSMVSSPAASNSAVSNDSFEIPELIGKLANICNSGEISPQSHPLLAATAAYIGGGNSSPLNSQSHLPIMGHFVKEKLPNLGKSMPLNPNLRALSDDPGFAERAAKFSCFGSRSFNGRTNQLGLNNTELPYRSSPLMGSLNLHGVSSSPSLKQAVSPMAANQENKNSTQTQMEMVTKNGSDTKFNKVPGSAASDRTEFASSNEGSSVSEQIPIGETGLKTPSDSNSRKRKAASRGKSKEIAPIPSSNTTKVAETEDNSNSKRCKSSEANGSENGSVKTEEEMQGTANAAGEEDHKQTKANQKLPEPPKDYIHVRARRGQATDSHSLAERVRREKISERMKLLQDLVPGCNKVTGKALMLDEIINYVQSLQRQVEFLSMKLASVNPRLDFNMDSLVPKDVLQPHPVYPLDSSASPFFGHQNQQAPQTHTNASNVTVTKCSVDPSVQLSLFDELCQGLPQFPTLCEDDLQSFVQMGFGQNANCNTGFHSQSFPGSSQTSHMKLEL
ncbi:unnamed protein product [Camellia sinensis]